MLLTPRYGDRPAVAVGLRDAGPHPVTAQRERLAGVLATLTEAQWQHPSRCAGWSVQDVVSHLVSTNGFWALSVQAGLGGEPTRFLASFDPVATPAQLAALEAGTPPATTLEQLVASNQALAEALAAVPDDDAWESLAEAPPGHVPIRLLADHALWDAWVHERDILLPLGLEPTVDADEVRTSLRYGACLGQAFTRCAGATDAGAVRIVVDDPADAFVVRAEGAQVLAEPDDPGVAAVVTAPAVPLLETLSTRDVGLAMTPEIGWLMAGLAEVFDQPSPV